MVPYKRTKNACYLTGMSMAISTNLSPLLFVTFKNMYHLSYALLGLLVVINFFTQLLIDLIFTFYTKYFNIHKTVRITPFIIFVGLILYAVLPSLFPDMAFWWIVIGTVIFSVASGLSEVLLSPLIAAIPSENPDHEMSKLHSMYAWSVVGVVILSTLYITFRGSENWMHLALLWSIVPFAAFIMFLKADLPQMDTFDKKQKERKFFNKGILLCVLCIFFGGASECTMSQWASGFIENAVGVSKIYGDVFGVALFAMFLGIGRTLYSKYGKNIINILLFGMIGASVCYLIASFALRPAVGIIACAMTGIFTSMLWPGTLIYVEEKIENVGVAIYALMAAGGDMGASLAPQLLGIISDKFSLTDLALKISAVLHISTEQVGMRAGLLITGVFPIAGIFCVLYTKKYFKKYPKTTEPSHCLKAE